MHMHFKFIQFIHQPSKVEYTFGQGAEHAETYKTKTPVERIQYELLICFTIGIGNY